MNKHIIIDLDETIGFFKQFIIIINIVETYCNIDYNHYFELLEDYFRPHMFDIFDFILKKKKSKDIKYVILYSNNKNDFFVKKVIQYINKKTNSIFFDYIITYHSRRLHTYKSYDDLLYCIPDLLLNDYFLFIDDKHHKHMKHPNIVYLKYEKYIFQYTYRAIKDKLKNVLEENVTYKDSIKHKLKKYIVLENQLPKSIHEHISQKILHSIEIFIYRTIMR